MSDREAFQSRFEQWLMETEHEVRRPPGLELRDLFAAVSLHAMVNGESSPSHDNWAQHAYRFADAMLSARARKEPKP